MVSWCCLAGATRDSPPMAACSLIYSHAKVLFFLQPMKLCRDNFARAPSRRFRILDDEREVFTIRSRFVRDGLGMRSGWRNPRKGCFCASLRAAKTTKMASWIKNHAENLDGSFFLRNFALAFENHPLG